MKKFNFGQTINILANIGVISGILFLAFEVQQYQAQLAAESRFNYYSTRIDLVKTYAIDPYLVPILAKITEGIELTSEESIRLNMYTGAVFIGWQYEIGEYLEGRITLLDLDIPGKQSTYMSPVLSFSETYLTFKKQRDAESPVVRFMEQYIVNP